MFMLCWVKKAYKIEKCLGTHACKISVYTCLWERLIGCTSECFVVEILMAFFFSFAHDLRFKTFLQ